MSEARTKFRQEWAGFSPEPVGPMTAVISPGLKYPDTPDSMDSFSRLFAWFLTM